jgi:uncharacterized protein YjiS (DUF1127 family)
LGEEVAMSVRALPPARQRLSSRLGGVQRVVALGLARLLRWHQLAHERRALLALSDHMLKDIGITRAEAEREASRPFWSDELAPRPDRRR